jgi:hypothetical protein
MSHSKTVDTLKARQHHKHIIYLHLSAVATEQFLFSWGGLIFSLNLPNFYISSLFYFLGEAIAT